MDSDEFETKFRSFSSDSQNKVFSTVLQGESETG